MWRDCRFYFSPYREKTPHRTTRVLLGCEFTEERHTYTGQCLNDGKGGCVLFDKLKQRLRNIIVQMRRCTRAKKKKKLSSIYKGSDSPLRLPPPLSSSRVASDPLGRPGTKEGKQSVILVCCLGQQQHAKAWCTTRRRYITSKSKCKRIADGFSSLAFEFPSNAPSRMSASPRRRHGRLGRLLY